MEDDDEVVIKIEYYDTNEEDPLREKSKENGEIVFRNKELGCQEKISYTKNEVKKTDSMKVDCCNERALCDEKYSNDIQSDEILDYNEVGCDKAGMKTWYENIDNTGRYTCKFCSLTYLNVQTLRRHVLSKHKSEGNILKKEVENNKRNRRFQCHICKIKFKTLSQVKEHVETMHGEEDSKSSCHICQAMFDDVSLMSAHLLAEHKIHYTKMFICNTCGYRTSKTSHFKQHQNTHSNKKSDKCKFCDYATNKSTNLKIHERIHLNCKPYVCSYEGCGYSAVARSALRSHLLKHKPEEHMVYCSQCTYKTVYKQSLKKHCDSHIRNTVKTIL